MRCLCPEVAERLDLPPAFGADGKYGLEPQGNPHPLTDLGQQARLQGQTASVEGKRMLLARVSDQVVIGDDGEYQGIDDELAPGGAGQRPDDAGDPSTNRAAPLPTSLARAT